MGKSEQFRFWSLVIGICLVIGIWLLGFVIGGCGQGQRALEESNYTSLIVSPATATLSVGETKQFVVSGLVKASSVTTNEVIWVVTGGIGTIDATGVFTATAEGSGTVEARVDSAVGRARVTVTGSAPVNIGINVEGLSVTPESVSLPVGATQQFRINGLNIKSLSASVTNVDWVVLGDIGTIDAKGLFTATAVGDGTVEAKVDLIVGRARVTVTGGEGKTLSGKVKNIFASGEGISSAVVVAGAVKGTSGSDGTYMLSSVPAETNVISAAAPGFFPASIALSTEATNIPLGGWFQSYNSAPTENTTIKGRVVDGSGNPITSSTAEVQFHVLLENGSGFSGSSYLYSTGAFSQSISVLKNQASTAGCIIVSYRDGTTYKAAIKEINVVSGITLEVGDIRVSEPAATLTGTVSPQGGYTVNYIAWGIMFSATNRRQVASSWGSNAYTFRVPATLSSKFYISIIATKGSDYIYYYIDNLSVISGDTLIQNPILPQGIDVIYPISGQDGVSTNPKFEWSSAGDGFAYIVFVGDAYWIKWWGLTNGTSIEYPSFPAGSGGEATNLQNGHDYYIAVAGYKDLNIYDLKDANEFSMASATVYHSATPFTVGSVSGSGMRSFDVKGRGEFDKKVGEYLKGIGVRTTKD